MKRILLAMALMPLISGPGFAEFDAGRDAFIRGDFAAAYREFLPTATAGDAKSSIGLGLLHARGLGVPKNMVQAHSWFDRAVRNSKGGNSVVRILAESNRDFLAKRMSTEQLAEAKFNNAATSASKDAVVSLVGGFAPVYRGRSATPNPVERTHRPDPAHRTSGGKRQGGLERLVPVITPTCPIERLKADRQRSRPGIERRLPASPGGSV
jgi:hypothetical protein